MLTLYRRHKPTCRGLINLAAQMGRELTDKEIRGVTKCKCKIWAGGTLAGRETRKSVGTRDWTKANQIVQQWEAAEQVTVKESAVTINESWKSMLADLQAQGLTVGTVRKYKLLERQMKAFAADRGLNRMDQLDLETLSRFRETWKVSPRTASKQLERLRAFFRFAHDRQWVETNMATKIKAPKVPNCPTLPFSDKEMVKIYAACDGYVTTAQNHGKLNAYRLKTLILLMRYSGLRISDAVALTTDKIEGKKLFLYMQKTGEPVYTILPDQVVEALTTMPKVTDTRYFWSGNGKRETVVCDWQMRIKEVLDLAGIVKGKSNAMSHRLRDSFAVNLLLSGVPIERVSILLGHSSVRITEKHYAPWVRERQAQLEADVARAWSDDPILNGTKLPRTKTVQILQVRPN